MRLKFALEVRIILYGELLEENKIGSELNLQPLMGQL